MPYSLEPKPYQEACAAKTGQAQMRPALASVASWLSSAYAVKVVFLALDQIDIGPAAGRPRLWVILESADDIAKLERKRWVLRPGVQEAIETQLAKACPQADIQGQRVLLALVDFSREVLCEAIGAFLDAEAPALSSELAASAVWKVTGSTAGRVVVFYLTDADLKANATNGQSDAIARRCFDLVKGHDQFGCVTLDEFPMTFDSKENLDANYEGSEFYYFR
jgi:hypothetical protein